MSASGLTPPESVSGSSSKPRKTRIARACEHCRTRRIKCEPPYPCQGCRDAGLTDCLVRDKARPMRRRRSQQSSSGEIDGSQYPERTGALAQIDKQLQQIFYEQTGRDIDLAIDEVPTHPYCDLSTPLPPMPPHPLLPDAGAAIRTFTEYMLPFCSYVTPPRVVALFERYDTAPSTLSPDQVGLVLSCLALGYVRMQGFVGREAVVVSESERRDVAYFRHSVDVLEKWGSASFTSLHALSGLWFYSTLACTSDTTRFIVSWMISQAKELGIHQEQTASAMTYSPSDRADLMFQQVLYSHYYATAQTGHAPMFRPGEFDSLVFASRPVVDPDAQVALVARRSLTEILLLNTQILMGIHDPNNKTLGLDWLMRAEERWAAWCAAWVRDGRTTGIVFVDQFLQVLWDWGRLVLRATTLNDPRLSVASYAVLARSACSILLRYHSIYRHVTYNLVWQHLRHVVTCAHIVLLCYWRFELSKAEAEQNLKMAAWMLSLMVPRWTNQASDARRKIINVANALGLTVAGGDDEDAKYNPPASVPSTAGGLDELLNVDLSQLNAAQSNFLLYEQFDPSTMTLPDWSVDSFFLGNEGYA